VLLLPLLRCSSYVLRLPLLLAAAAAAHSAAHLLWPRGLSAAASQSPAGPLGRRSTQNKGQFHVTFLEKWSQARMPQQPVQELNGVTSKL
jgi:hypothetical protein